MVSYIPGISASGSLAPGLTPADVRAVLDLLSSAEIAAAYLPLAGGSIVGSLDVINLTAGGFVDASELKIDGQSINSIFALTSHNHAGESITSGTVPFERLPVGTTAVTVCAGNDPRLSDARTPLAHTQPASTISDFAEAVDDEVATLLQAGTDVTVTYNDAANTLTVGLGSNVPRLNAANAFTGGTQTFGVAGTSNGQIVVGAATSVNAQITIGGSPNLVLTGRNNVLGATWQIITDTTGSGGPAAIRIGSTGSFGFGNAASNVGTVDVSIVRNATGPTAETRAAGGLRVCNADGSALGPVNCGRANVSDFNAGSGTVFVNSSTGRLLIYNAGMLGWTASGTAETIPDTGISRASAGVLQIGTTSNNASGQLNLARILIGGGTAIAGVLSATATLDFPSIAASSFADLTITVTGAVSGDTVIVNPIAGSATNDVVYTGWVSAANTVTIRASNVSSTTARDPASGTFRATVVRF